MLEEKLTSNSLYKAEFLHYRILVEVEHQPQEPAEKLYSPIYAEGNKKTLDI